MKRFKFTHHIQWTANKPTYQRYRRHHSLVFCILHQPVRQPDITQNCKHCH